MSVWYKSTSFQPHLLFPAASDDGLSVTLESSPESETSLILTTQDTDRRRPMFTTAPPFNVPNHHPVYRNPPQQQAPLGPHGLPNNFEDSGGFSSHPSVQPTFSTLPFGTPLDLAMNGDKRASRASSSNMQTALVIQTLAANSHNYTHAPATRAVLKDPEQTVMIPSATAAREKDMRPDWPELMQNVRPGIDEEETTTTTTTTTITTMQSPGKNGVLCLFKYATQPKKN